MIYFDFEKDFNYVPYLRMFNEFGIPGSLHSWIQSFLSKRTILVNIGEEHSKYMGVVSVFPQGSLLTRFFVAMQKWLHAVPLAGCGYVRGGQEGQLRVHPMFQVYKMTLNIFPHKAYIDNRVIIRLYSRQANVSGEWRASRMCNPPTRLRHYLKWDVQASSPMLKWRVKCKLNSEAI